MDAGAFDASLDGGTTDGGALDLGPDDAGPAPSDLEPDATPDDGGEPDLTRDAPDEGRPCSPGACPEGDLCSAATGQCEEAPACNAHEHCPAETLCGGDGVCLRPPQPDCAEDADCPPGWLCDRWRGGWCVPPATCASDEDCWPGAGCVLDASRCGECGPGLPCSGSQRCLPGPTPWTGSCADAARCVHDDDCPGGRRCVDTLCSPAACADDTFEPNDGAFQAPTLRERLYPSLVLCGVDLDDWYAIELPPGAGLRVLLRAADPAPLRLRLYADDARLDVLAEDATLSGLAQVVARQNERDETIRLLLRVSSDLGRERRYSLDVRLPPDGACAGDARDREPGDPEPRELGAQSVSEMLCPRGLDRFSVEALQPDTLTVQLQSDTRPPPRVTITDDEGRVLATGRASLGGWQTRTELAAAGRYRVLVSGDVPAVGADYQLSATLGPTPELTRCEAAPQLEDEGGAAATGPATYDLLDSHCGAAGRPEGIVRLALTEPRGLSLEGSPDTTLSVWTACGAPATELACAPAGTPLRIATLAPGEYQLAAEPSEEVAQPPEELTVALEAPAPPPPNDRCEAALALPSEEEVAGDPYGALPPQWPNPCADSGEDLPTLYYAFELEERTSLSLNLDSAGELALALQTGCDGAVLGCGPGAQLLGPGEHVVAVSAPDDGLPHPFRLGLTLAEAPAPPPHSSCEQAAPLALGLPLEGETRRATDDDAPPCGGAGPDLHYRLSVPAGAEEERQVLLLQATADFPARIGLRASCEGEWLGCWTVDGAARLRTTVEAGDALLTVDGPLARDWGAFSLLASLPAPPAGDTCAQPLLLEHAAEQPGDTAAARNDLDGRALGCGQLAPMGGPDLAYAVDLEAGEELSVELTTEGWDGALYVVESCEGACLAATDRALRDEPERLSWVAESAGRYYLIVDAFAGWGSYRLRRIAP